MENDKDAPATSRPASSFDPVVALQAPPPPLPNPTPTQPSSSIAASASTSTKDEPPPPGPAPAPGPQRLRFAVELRPGETTIVSWKRLLKESGKGSESLPNAAPADRPLAAQAGADGVLAEGEQKDELPPPNRFSAVIEKIERLYMGNQSSDEELDDIPDDDQYDTEDSFIDDAELDEYFHVDKMSTKHSGFFVNKGNLEQMEVCSSSQEAPKRRRRKDPTKMHGEGSRIVVPSDPTNIDNLQVKNASKNEPASRRKASPKVVAPYGEHHNDERPSKYESKAITIGYKRKSADLAMKPEESSTKSVLYKEFPSLQLESKDFGKHKAGSYTSKDGMHKYRTDDLMNPLHLAARNKGQVEIQSKKLLNGEGDVSAKMRRKERYGSRDFPAVNSTESAYSTYGMQQASARVKEGSAVRPKGTTLERAIRDLQKIVAECRPPSFDLQEVDPAFQGIKRRLPREVKQKLAKVARLSASQGRISEDELVDRLMGILGHLVQRKTLKKNVREMVVLGISAKQQKADRFQQIKKEVNEMIRARVSQSKSKFTEQRDGSTDDFQEVTNDGTRSSKGRYNMDAALEDKICDLYDLYVEGMDEDKGPQSRKLYVELADLWPSGYMDNVGIKDAIYRSKERKRVLYRQLKVRDEERIKRKKLASTIRAEKPHPAPPIRPGQENPVQVVSTKSQVFASLDELDPSNRGSTGKSLYSIPHPTDSGLQHALKNQDEVRGVNMSTNPNPVETSKTSVDVRKS